MVVSLLLQVCPYLGVTGELEAVVSKVLHAGKRFCCRLSIDMTRTDRFCSRPYYLKLFISVSKILCDCDEYEKKEEEKYCTDSISLLPAACYTSV